MMDLNDILVAVEFGYIQCEKGHNLQMALSEARKVLSRPRIESDLLAAIKTGHHNSLTLWAREYDIDIPAGGDWKDRCRLAVEQIKKRSNTMAKEVKKPASGKAAESAKETKKAAEPEKPKMLGSKEVAEMLGIEGTALRRFLRAKGIEKNDGRYAWKPDSKELAGLKKAYEAYEKELEEKKEKAEKAKSEGGKKKSKKSSKKSKKEDEDEGLEEENDGETEEL